MNIRDMNLDQLKDHLIDCKKELTTVNKRQRALKSQIINASKLIDKLSYVPDADRMRINRLISRDKDICIDYIRKFGRTPTRELIHLLNDSLDGEDTRWKDNIDSNRFMTTVGKYLQNQINIKYEKDMDPVSKRMTTYWWVV